MTDVAKLHRDTAGIYLIEVGPWFYYGHSRVAAEAIGCHRQSVDNFASGASCPQNPRSRKLGVLKVERF